MVLVEGPGTVTNPIRAQVYGGLERCQLYGGRRDP